MSTPAEFYNSLPPIVKFYGTSCLLTTIAVHCGLVHPLSLYFNPRLAFKSLQIWRLVTNFIFLGPFSPSFAILLIMLVRYGVQVERAFNRRGQFAWMLVLAMLTLLGMSTLMSLFFHSSALAFMGPVIVFVLLYLWSREFPNAGVSILGLVTIQGFYLPWAMLFANAIFGHSVYLDFLGIVIGHVYYFFSVVHPKTGGKDFLQAPRFFLKLLNRLGVPDGAPQQAPPAQHQQQSPAPTSAAFRGRSYRLNRD